MSEPGGPIGERVAKLEMQASAQKTDIEELQRDVSALKRFQSWVLGVAAGVGSVATLLAQLVKDRIGHS